MGGIYCLLLGGAWLVAWLDGERGLSVQWNDGGVCAW